MSVKLIAEIGCNHKGDIEIATDMIKIASQECNVDIVKFQKRSIKDLLTEEEYKSPHPISSNSYGSNYGKHREFLEFNYDQHLILKKTCEKYGVDYSSSVWDITSAEEIIDLNPNLIKIPSAQNLNLELLKFIYDNFNKEVHISLGMTTSKEIELIFNFIKTLNRLKDTVFYHCTSTYPANFEDLNLLEISELTKRFSRELKCVGFSGHHNGIAIDVSAVTLGAKYIERHFTLDRTWKGTDHAASLEPQGMRKLKRDLINLDKALKYKSKHGNILESEIEQYKKLKWKKN